MDEKKLIDEIINGFAPKDKAEAADSAAERLVDGYDVLYGEGELEEESELGNPRAQYQLAEIYDSGPLEKRDYNKAVRLYELSALQGYDKAQNAYGWCFFIGKKFARGYALVPPRGKAGQCARAI